MKQSAPFKNIQIAALVAGLVLFSHTPPAEAAWFRKDQHLGTLTTADNANYWRSQRQIAMPTPPTDRNKLCQWKYGNNNVWGKAASWWGADQWKTHCYRWRWFWQ